MGVYIGQSTKIYDRATGEISYGRVPAGSVVVSGNLPKTAANDAPYSMYAAIIVKRVDAQTRPRPASTTCCATDPAEEDAACASPGGGTMGMMEKLMRLMAEKKASDLFLSARCTGADQDQRRQPSITSQLLPSEAFTSCWLRWSPPDQLRGVRGSGELNMAVPLVGIGRFRLSAMRQKRQHLRRGGASSASTSPPLESSASRPCSPT